MSRKNTLRYSIVEDQSLSANFESPITLIPRLDNCSYQINITTTDSIGTFYLQGSNDFEKDVEGNVVNPGSWVDLPLGGDTSAPIANAANDSILIDINQVPFNALRIRYSASTPGTGTCDIWFNGRMLG